jgi:hypothetical protein
MTASRRRFVEALIAAAAALTVIGITRTAAAGPVLPEFSPANFPDGATITNPYFPLTPGTTYRASGNVTDPEDGSTVHEVDEDAVTFQTRTIAGVTARVVHARGFEDGVLAEDTNDFYAQDKDGNVWYMGEDTTAFERDDAGNIIGRDKSGSWLAGVNGAKPGFIMPARPAVGFNHYQEFSPADGALDQATILSLDETVTVPVGTFTRVLKTQEETELEPGVVEFKYYAAGIGLIRAEEDVNASGQAQAVILLDSVTTAATVPLPTAARAALAAAALLLTPRALRRRAA